MFSSEGEFEHLEIFLEINHLLTETLNGNFFLLSFLFLASGVSALLRNEPLANHELNAPLMRSTHNLLFA